MFSIPKKSKTSSEYVSTVFFIIVFIYFGYQFGYFIESGSRVFQKDTGVKTFPAEISHNDPKSVMVQPDYKGNQISAFNKSEETINVVQNSSVGEPQSLTCAGIQNLLAKEGFSISSCNGRIGNQLGLISLGLAIYRQFGVKLRTYPSLRLFSHTNIRRSRSFLSRSTLNF